MLEFDSEVIAVIQRTKDVKSFRFKVNQDIDFKPGQFFFVKIKVLAEERTKHFSFSNSPTETGYLEFTKRITQSPFSQSLDRLKPGDWAKLKMPFGTFTFEGEYEKIAFLSGGIGITPIRSICKFAADKKLSTDIVLLYGNTSAADIIFRDDLDQMSKQNTKLRIVYTLTSSDINKLNWPGGSGYIDENMIKEEIPDYQKRVFYICGPPQMVEGLNALLKEKLNVNNQNIRLENFTGY